MSIQCYGRLAKVSQKGKIHHISFGNRGKTRHRAFLEYRCLAKAEPNEKLCSDCKKKQVTNLEQKNQFRLLHGLVDEAIPVWSQIFEGPWYESKVKIVGHPTEEDMARGKKAQLEARKGVDENKEETVPPEALPASPKKGRKNEVETSLEKTTSKRRVKKTLPNGTSQDVISQAIETMETLKDIEVVRITVKRFEHNNTSYFRDVSKNKLYAVGKDTKPSHYVGRWNPDTETIDTDFPDSDSE